MSNPTPLTDAAVKARDDFKTWAEAFRSFAAVTAYQVARISEHSGGER